MLTVPSLGTLSPAYKKPATTGSYLYTHPKNFFDSPLLPGDESGDGVGALKSSAADRSSHWVLSGGQVSDARAANAAAGSPNTSSPASSVRTAAASKQAPGSSQSSSSSHSLSASNAGNPSVANTAIGGKASAPGSTSSGSNTSLNSMDSLYFEVRYVGRIKVSHRKGPPTFIDDALEKFRQVDKTTGPTPPVVQQHQVQQKEPQQAPSKQQQQKPIRQESSASSLLAAAKSYLPTSPKRREASHDDVFESKEHQADPAKYGDVGPNRGAQSRPIPVTGAKEASVYVSVIPPTPEEHKYLGNPMKVPPDIRRIVTTRVRAASGSEVPRAQSHCELESQSRKDRRSAGPEDLNHRKHSADAVNPTGASGGHQTALKTSSVPVATSPGGLQSSRNRTMVLCISSTAVSIVSPDKKSELLKRSIRDISHCSQGIKHADHFGFICREPHIDLNVGYVFQCQSAQIVDYIMKAIQVCFQAALEVSKQELRDAGLCEYCPLTWYQKLCALVNGLPLPRAYQILASKVDGLPEKDRDLILAKLEGGEPFESLQEKNTLLMMLLRAHCEAKQVEHSHRLPERNEPIEKSVSFPLILGKAKKSILTSFDAFMKQGGGPQSGQAGERQLSQTPRGSKGDLDMSNLNGPKAKPTSVKEDQTHCYPTRSPTPAESKSSSHRQLSRASPISTDQRPSGNKRDMSHPLPITHSGDSIAISETSSSRTVVPSLTPSPGRDEEEREISPQPILRPRSSTLSTSGGSRLKRELARSRSSTEGPLGLINSDSACGINSVPRMLMQTSPLSISHPGDADFLTVDTMRIPGGSEASLSPNAHLKGGSGELNSWRKIIFQRIVAAPRPDASTQNIPAVLQVIGSEREKRNWKVLKFLWKKAVFRQILLRRIEMKLAKAGAVAFERRVSSVSMQSDTSNNQTVSGSSYGQGKGQSQQQTARDDRDDVVQAKLWYEDVGQTIPQDEQWALLLNADVKSDRLESKLLEDSVRKGVPKRIRGKVWQLLVHHTRSTAADADSKAKPDLHSEYAVDTPYEELLKQLTAQQHAILIDLARTFPTHPYFSQALGQGQLELFNLLKAYSILDGDVGYCQGLSFIAALILMHMDEKSAWDTFLHVLVDRDLRSHYVGNLGGLQLCLYQLSRLLVDRKPELAQHLDNLSAPPTLYASPWFLSIFTADFPVGFGVRVMDLILLQGRCALIKVALVVLEKVEEELLVLESLEEVMEYLKSSLPKHSLYLANQIIQTAADLDISAQLRTYEIEYQVLQEEIGVASEEAEQRKKEQHAKVVVDLQRHNRMLLEKLEKRNESVQKLQGLLAHQRQVEMRMQEKLKGLEGKLQVTTKAVQNMEALQQPKNFSPPSVAEGVIRPQTPPIPSVNLPGSVKSARMSRLCVRSASTDRDFSPADAKNKTQKKSMLERETHQFLSPSALRRAGQQLQESQSFDNSRLRRFNDTDDDDDDPFRDDSVLGASSSWPYDMSPVPVISIKPEDYVRLGGTGGGRALELKGGTMPMEKVRLRPSDDYGSSVSTGDLAALGADIDKHRHDDWLLDGPRSNSEPEYRQRLQVEVQLALMDPGSEDEGGLSEDDVTVSECRSRLSDIRKGIETGIKRLAEYRKSVHTAEDELLSLRRADVCSFGAIEELASTTAKLQSAELQLKAARDCLDKAYSHLPPSLRSHDFR